MNAEEQTSYDLFVKRLITIVSLYIYVCAGLYWVYPKALNMLFWPFHYGWLAH